ncbi:MAG: hypothetical protein ACHQYP_05940 [Nitrospiria bacterium]
MNGKFTYDRKEVEQIVLEHHHKTFPPPEGMEWEAHEQYNNVEVELEMIKEKKDETE